MIPSCTGKPVHDFGGSQINEHRVCLHTTKSARCQTHDQIIVCLLSPPSHRSHPPHNPRRVLVPRTRLGSFSPRSDCQICPHSDVLWCPEYVIVLLSPRNEYPDTNTIKLLFGLLSPHHLIDLILHIILDVLLSPRNEHPDTNTIRLLFGLLSPPSHPPHNPRRVLVPRTHLGSFSPRSECQICPHSDVLWCPEYVIVLFISSQRVPRHVFPHHDSKCFGVQSTSLNPTDCLVISVSSLNVPA